MLSGRMVQINVGKGNEHESIAIHHGLLCFYSGYFRDVFNNRSIDESNTIDLPDEEVGIFKRFQLWLYSHTFDQDCKQKLDRMVELWVFADEYRVPLLQNMVLNEIRNRVALKRVLPDTAQINFVYEHTVPNSGLRHFVIDVVYRLMPSGDVLHSDDSNGLPKEALCDILRLVWPMWEGGIRKCPSQSNVEHWDMCRYHVHEDGVSCSQK